MAVYISNEQAGFRDKSPEQIAILVAENHKEYGSACIPIGINFDFGQIIYRGKIHLFKKNKNLFDK